nr:hypothetical protein [Streptomyces sp. V4I2]
MAVAVEIGAEGVGAEAVALPGLAQSQVVLVGDLRLGGVGAVAEP